MSAGMVDPLSFLFSPLNKYVDKMRTSGVTKKIYINLLLGNRSVGQYNCAGRLGLFEAGRVINITCTNLH